MKMFTRFVRKTPPAAATLQEGAASSIPEPTYEDTVRAAAIARLPDGQELRRLAGLSAPNDSAAPISPPLMRAAQSRLAQLIDEGTVDFAELCPDPRSAAQLVAESRSSRMRQLAAQAIEDPVDLKQLLKQVGGKDKNVYKILKQKSDAQHAEIRKAAEIEGEIAAVSAALEHHSHRSYDTLFTATFDELDYRWRAVNTHAEANIAQRVREAIDRCKEVVAGHLRELARQAADQAARQAAEVAARDAREQAHRAAQDAASAQADAEAERRKEAAAAREAQEAARAEKKAAEDRVLRQIGGLLRKANEALSEGNTQGAAGLRRAIQDKWPAMPEAPAYLTKQLLKLDDKLNELKQWKDYAVAPKRTALIEEMEALIGSTEAPKALSERIKSLQEEWRTTSKGIVSEDSADWERFHRASQAAYRPCREHFEALAAQRQENLQNRKAVVERLTAFEAAQNEEIPDWRLMARVLREAPQEWRRYFPVDRDANRAVQEDFDAAMGRLQAKLDTWYEANVADKQALIKRARYLLSLDDSREAIEAVKGLQISWKETGTAPRDRDQALWSEFHELCDGIYQKRHAAHAQYAAALEATRLKAAALCEEAEAAAELSGSDLSGVVAKIPDWRAAFGALAEMPRADARTLHDRFERAIGRCGDRIAQQRAADAEKSFTDLFEAAQHIRAYGWSVAQREEASRRETLKQSAEAFISNVNSWPKGGLHALNEALKNAASLSDVDTGAREKTLRLLCVRCEIRNETATPPEDEGLRREYQVQRLVRGMGQGERADDGDWDAMTLEWIRIGAISPPLHEALQKRFMGCRAMRQVRVSGREFAAPNDRKSAGDGLRQSPQRRAERRPR